MWSFAPCLKFGVRLNMTYLSSADYQQGFDSRSIEAIAMGDQNAVRHEEFVCYKKKGKPQKCLRNYS
jgi:hypothetical protein